MSTTNGKQPVPDPELISAFYDAETSAEELAVVQQSMVESNDPVQALEDYEQLSQILRVLHRSNPAPDLRESVLSAVAKGGVSGDTVAADPPSSSWIQRRGMQVIAGLTGLAAAVALLLWPTGRLPQPDVVAVRDEMPLHDAALPSVAEFGDQSLMMATDGVGEAAPVAGEAASSAVNDEMEANIALSLERIARSRKLPAVGDVVGYLDHNAEDLTWVAVTVADVQEAGDKVQMLLTRNGVEPPAGTPPHPEPAQGSNEHVTFVVEADWDQMEAVIVDLSEEAVIRSVEVDAPDDEGVPRELQNYAFYREERLHSDDGRETAEKLRQRVVDRQSNSPNAATLRGGLPQSEPPAAGNAVQLQANVPDAELKRIAARRAAESPSMATAEKADDQNLNRYTDLPLADEAIRRSIVARPRVKALIILQTK